MNIALNIKLEKLNDLCDQVFDYFHLAYYDLESKINNELNIHSIKNKFETFADKHFKSAIKEFENEIQNLKNKSPQELMNLEKISSEINSLNQKDNLINLKEKLFKSIEIRLRSDFPIAFFLSGGIDSNSLAFISKNYFNYKMKTYSIIGTDPKYDESKMINFANKNLNADHTNLSINLKKLDFIKILKKQINYHDSPVSTINSLLNFQLYKEVKKDGFKVSITGEVNAGKSSLLNLIAKRDVAIVSDEAGTTRDVIETYLNIDGYPVILADTAGIRDAKNEVEKKGISLALGQSKEADLNIVVIDNSSKSVNNENKKMINKATIVLLNKSDVLDEQNHKFDADTILASVKENKNIDNLIKKIKEKLSKKFTSNNTALITRERHRVKLNECLKEIDNFLKKDQNKDLELAAEDLRMATRHLGSIVGKVDVEEILGSIFKDFCIGK